MIGLLRNAFLALVALAAAGAAGAAPFAYVLTNDGVAVFDTATHERIGTIPATGRHVAARLGSTRVLIAGTPIQVIDTNTQAVVGTLPAVDAYFTALSPTQNKAVVLEGCERVTCSTPSRARLIDTDTGAELGSFQQTGILQSATFNASGTLAFIADSANNVVYVRDTQTFQARPSIAVPQFPERLAAHPSAERLYVADLPFTIREYDTTDNSLVHSFGTTGNAQDIMIDARARLFVGLNSPKEIVEYDTAAANAFVANYHTGSSITPEALDSTPDSAFLYAVCDVGLAIYSTATHEMVRLHNLTSTTVPRAVGRFIGGPVPGTSPPGKVTPTVSLASSRNPSSPGESVTFTASVSGSAGTATGSVQFLEGTLDVPGCGTVALVSGSAACTTNALSAGNHSVTASYSGNASYNPAVSFPVNQQVRVASSTALASSLNPSALGDSVSFTAVVSGGSGTPTGTVAFLNGATAISGCAAVALSGGAAGCAISGLPQGTHSITARYSGNATYNPSTSAAVSQVVNAPANGASNVALASAGSTATVSSNYAPGWSSAAAVIDNEHTGAHWGNNGGWEDGTDNAYPDWVEIQFDGTKSIDRVVVYTLADSFGMEPTDTTSASTYGIRDFTVEGWTGSAWQVLATVTGNTLAKRTLTFAAFTTSRIRINVTAAAYFKTRIVEVEAWGS